MSPRVLAAFVLLPLAIAAERFAWYSARSVTYLRLRDLGGDLSEMSSSFALPLLGGVIGGALAALLLPRVVLVAGALCTAGGWLLASRATDAESFTLAMHVAAIGSGVMKGCLYGLAILVMPTPRLRTLYVVVTYLVVNLVSLVAPATSAWLTTSVGYEALFFGLHVLVIAGAVPAVIVIVVDKLAPRDPAPARHHGRAVLGALAMVGVGAPLFMAFAGAGGRIYDVSLASGADAAAIGLVQVVPVLATIVALVVLLVVLGTRAGAATSPLRIIGVASLVAAAGAAIALVPSFGAVVLGMVVLAAAEVAAPLALARGLANHHPRVVTAVVGFTLAFTWAASAIPHPLASLLIAIPLLCVSGGVLLVAGARFDAWLDEAPPSPAARESWLSGRGAGPDQPSSHASSASNS